jgi:phosphoglucomutase
VISGDGRYYNREAVQVIAKIAVAHGVSTLWIGQVKSCFAMIFFFLYFL